MSADFVTKAFRIGKGLDDDDDELIKKSQLGLDTDEDHDVNGTIHLRGINLCI